jgi:hypothetical protein
MRSRSALNERIAGDIKQLGILRLLYQDEWWEDIVKARALRWSRSSPRLSIPSMGKTSICYRPITPGLLIVLTIYFLAKQHGVCFEYGFLGRGASRLQTLLINGREAIDHLDLQNVETLRQPIS